MTDVPQSIPGGQSPSHRDILPARFPRLTPTGRLRLAIAADVLFLYLTASLLIAGAFFFAVIFAALTWILAARIAGRATHSWRPARHALRVRRRLHLMMPCLLLCVTCLKTGIEGRYGWAPSWDFQSPTLDLRAMSNAGILSVNFILFESPRPNYQVTAIQHSRSPGRRNTRTRWGFGRTYGTGAQEFRPTYWIGYRAGSILFPASLPILATLPPILLWLYRLRRAWWLNHRLQSRQCLICGYDLRASPDRCPECGTQIHADAEAIAGPAGDLQPIATPPG